MLQVFYLDVASVCNGFQEFFRCFCKCFGCIFQVFYLSSFYMLQVLYLNVSIVDRDIAHDMSVGSRRGREQSPHVVWWCKRRPKRRWHATRALACKSDAAGTFARSLHGHCRR
jgi:hypothetical protein